MGWYGLVSLITDGRIKFLLGFVVIAVIIAAILTIVEIRMKKKKVRREAKVSEESFLEKLRKYIRSDKTPIEKLDFLDKTAKNYFKEIYATPLNSNYTMLIRELEKNKRKNEVSFSKAMFATYYSRKELTEEQVRALTKLFINMVNRKERLDEISRVPSFMEKFSNFFKSRSKASAKKKALRVKNKHNRRLEKTRVVNYKKALREAALKEKKFSKAQRVLIKKSNRVSKKKAIEDLHDEKILSRVRKATDRKKSKLIKKRTRVLRKQRIKDLRASHIKEKTRAQQEAVSKRILSKEEKKNKKKKRKALVRRNSQETKLKKKALVEKRYLEKIAKRRRRKLLRKSKKGSEKSKPLRKKTLVKAKKKETTKKPKRKP
jgi:hypothetical protein